MVAGKFEICEMVGIISVVLLNRNKCNPITLGYSLAMIYLTVSQNKPLMIVEMVSLSTYKVIAGKYETC